METLRSPSKVDLRKHTAPEVTSTMSNRYRTRAVCSREGNESIQNAPILPTTNQDPNRCRTRAVHSREGNESIQNALHLPTINQDLVNGEICEKMPWNEALEQYKSRVFKLVGKLRKYKVKNGYDREKTDWWFPIISKEDEFFSNLAGTYNKNQEGFGKTLFPDFASNLGLSICEFNILKNATKRRWKNPIAQNFGTFKFVLYKDQGVEWILLDESASKDRCGPLDQCLRNKCKFPPWLICSEVTYKSVSRKNNHKGQKRRAAELLASNDGLYENESDDENDKEEVEARPSNLGRPKGSKDNEKWQTCHDSSIRGITLFQNLHPLPSLLFLSILFF